MRQKTGEVAGDQACVLAHGHFSAFVVGWYSSKSGKTGPLFNNQAGGYQTANGSRVGYGGAPGKYFTSTRGVERAKSILRVKPASKMAIANGFGRSARSAKFAKAGAGGGSKGG